MVDKKEKVKEKTKDKRAPSIGDKVLYFMPRNGEPRPAFVVRVWEGETTVNLQVLTDQRNDQVMDNVIWKTNIKHSPKGEPNTWTWI